jgi:hypothetical protein
MQNEQPATFDRVALDGMVAYIQQRLVKTVSLTGEDSFLALAETAERFNETRWFWTDDNAKAIELLCEPRLFDADPSYTNAAIDFVLRMSEGAVIQRRCGPPELRVLSTDPRAFRVETAFFIIEGDLSKGIVRHALRFNDGRTVTAAQHTGNIIAFRHRGRGFSLDVENAITSHSVEVNERSVVLSHTSSIVMPASWVRRQPPTVAGTLRYTYTVSADRPAVALQVSFDLAPDIALDDIVITTALDQLTIVPGVDYRTLAIRAGETDHAIRHVPDARTSVHEGPADYTGIVQEGASPGFSYGIHVLLRDGARLNNILARGQTEGRLHWILYRYGVGSLPKGGRVALAEERMLTGGGYYDALSHYQTVMRDAAGGGSNDPSMTYDIGAELNAIAVHVLFARSGCYTHPPEATRVATLQAWYDRHLQRYFDFIRPGSDDDLARIFTRGIAFVALSLDCMLRATGEARYRTQLALAVGLIMRMRRRLPCGRDQHDTTFGDSWAGHTPFLDNDTACILALARAARHGDPDGTLSAAISEAILGIKLYSGVVYLNPAHSEACDSLAVLNPPGTDMHADTGFWNFKLGVTLRALRAVERAAASGALRLSAADLVRITVRRDLCIRFLSESTRQHGGLMEVLTSRIAGETNSETQPWVALGLVPIVDERIEMLGVGE